MQPENSQNEKPHALRGRHENRIAAMQFIYMRDMNESGPFEEALQSFLTNKETELAVRKGYFQFARELIVGAFTHAKEIDGEISKNAKNWSIDRIAKVELAILRLAVFELLFRDDIPPVVTINEAVDLTKEFSGDDSKRFVNGLLDKISLSLKRPMRQAVKK